MTGLLKYNWDLYSIENVDMGLYYLKEKLQEPMSIGLIKERGIKVFAVLHTPPIALQPIHDLSMDNICINKALIQDDEQRPNRKKV